MRIGIIGAGHVGTTLGDGWARAGHEVVYGRRGAVRAAVEGADAIVLATPWGAVDDALRDAGDLGGRPLVDATNPIGPGFSLAVGHTTSGAEQIAARARSARVVKAFNTTGVENMANPRYGARRVMMPVAGDDGGAVAIAAELAGALGFEPVALPSLARARELEPFALLWIKLALQLGLGRGIGFSLARRGPDDAPPTVRAAAAKTITIAGAGNIGGALARAWLRAGHRVRIAVRDAAAPDVAALVAAGATAVPLAGAAAGSDAIVLAVPHGAVGEVTRALGDLRGAVVVDCTNAIGAGMTLARGHTDSSPEELARALPGARVVRAFNQQGAEVLANPSFGGVPAAAFVASDDDDARAQVLALARDAGLDGIGAGPLASARLLDPVTLLWIAIARALGTRDVAITLARR